MKAIKVCLLAALVCGAVLVSGCASCGDLFEGAGKTFNAAGEGLANACWDLSAGQKNTIIGPDGTITVINGRKVQQYKSDYSGNQLPPIQYGYNQPPVQYAPTRPTRTYTQPVYVAPSPVVERLQVAPPPTPQAVSEPVTTTQMPMTAVAEPAPQVVSGTSLQFINKTGLISSVKVGTQLAVTVGPGEKQEWPIVAGPVCVSVTASTTGTDVLAVGKTVVKAHTGQNMVVFDHIEMKGRGSIVFDIQ